ncbi:MAG: hypothetical protein V3T84_04265 [Phycisphaerales bacterium]
MKRRLFKLVVFLLLGAVVNVAVTWGCAAWSKLHVTTVRGDQGFIRRACQHNFGDDQRITFDGFHEFNRLRGFGVRWDRHHASYKNSGAMAVRSYFQMGWPDYAVEGWYEFVGIGDLATHWSHHPRVWLGNGETWRPLILAFRPLWPGFAINTIFYATILWMSFLGPFVARRFVRHKHGHCIKCGYDLRGAEHEVCPECASPHGAGRIRPQLFDA